ncbi:MAG: hypothetical protein OEV68_07405, partial [candidate division Zixibacteria bacterium]|nr:hypothetical protein [candidate division Zixibacteria bacterium]
MIKWRLVPFTLLLSLLCIYSCDDDEKIINGGSNGDPPPDGVGLLWIYEVYDSLTLTTDTVWVSVTDTVSHSDGATSLRLRLNWTVADVVVDRYAKIQGDTIDITSDTTVGSMFLERFILPLTVGSEWIVSGGTDTSRVTDVGTVTVEAGRFDSAALIERVWNRDFEGGG